MNEAHLHLLVNHFPIIGLIFGFAILLGGIFYRNNALKNTAYLIFIIASISTLVSAKTGHGAEEIVEEMASVGHHVIHEHEEIAEKFAVLVYLLGFISIMGLYANIKNHAKAKLISYFSLILAAVGIFLAVNVGKTGGEIRHTEIRNEPMGHKYESHESTDHDE